VRIRFAQIKRIKAAPAMDVLVDFDNLNPQMKRAGLALLTARIVDAITGIKKKFPDRCRLRFYGGWYADERLTDQAEELITQIEDNKNALVVPWSIGGNQGKTLAQLEMAYGLEVEPQRPLFFTLRTRPFGDHIRSNKFRLLRCDQTDCPVRVAVRFFDQKRCLKDRCHTTPGDVFSKSEQKLVDTMLTADLIYLGRRGHKLAVVSSDDDLWPGMQTALLQGAEVIQLHTHPSMFMPKVYIRGLKEFSEALLT
jgi:hypothetical protein